MLRAIGDFYGRERDIAYDLSASLCDKGYGKRTSTAEVHDDAMLASCDSPAF